MSIISLDCLFSRTFFSLGIFLSLILKMQSVLAEALTFQVIKLMQ